MRKHGIAKAYNRNMQGGSSRAHPPAAGRRPLLTTGAAAELASCHEATIRRAVALLGSGSLVPDALITHRMALDGVPDALALMARSEALKVLIEP